MLYSERGQEPRSGVRPEAFEVLSNLLLHGVLGSSGSSGVIPEVVAHLAESEDTTALGREHERLFDQVPPFASVFLEVDGSVGGDVGRAMARRLRAAGLSETADTPPDHVGNELALLARLIESGGARQGADRADGAPDEVLTFLDGHLLWWTPALVATLLRHGSPYWCRVAESLLHLGAEQRCALVGDRAPGRQAPWNLMGLPPDPLDDPRTGLRAIAVFLSHPVRSGLYLSEAEAHSLAHHHRIPPGGRPAQILESALHSAVAYGGLETTCERLETITVDTTRVLMDAHSVNGLHQAFLAPWLLRLDRTRRMLARMRSGEGPVS